MMLVIDPDSGVAPYEQLRGQIEAAVRAGELLPGAQLPTVRRLADDLGIAPNTVARSYRELEREGVIQTRGRNGSVVAAATVRSVHEDPGVDAAQAFALRSRELGLAPTEALALVRTALGLAGTTGESPAG
jgi:DNA-binding transcriptional regulator YhcF (GntR family)